MNKKECVVYIVITGLLFAILLLWEQKGQLKTDLDNGLRSAFAPQITEIEEAIGKANYDHYVIAYRDLTGCRQTRQFLYTLLKSEIFVSEIKKREKQESFDPPVRGWRVPWKQEFGLDGKVICEWGFIFRMEGPDTKMFPTCLAYFSYAGTAAKLDYLGNDHGLSTVEEAKDAVIKALKTGPSQESGRGR